MNGLSVFAITAVVGLSEAVIIDTLTYHPRSHIRVPSETSTDQDHIYVRMQSVISAMNTTAVLTLLMCEAVVFTVNNTWL